MANDNLTTQAMEGYQAAATGAANPYLGSSAGDIAWAAGYWLACTHRTSPRNVRMSRGYTIRANDMLLKWHGRAEFERIS